VKCRSLPCSSAINCRVVLPVLEISAPRKCRHNILSRQIRLTAVQSGVGILAEETCRFKQIRGCVMTILSAPGLFCSAIRIHLELGPRRTRLNIGTNIIVEDAGGKIPTAACRIPSRKHWQFQQGPIRVLRSPRPNSI
jgi:hypothetical protein